MLTPHRFIATAALSLIGTLSAQCPPGAPMPLDLTLETTLPPTGPAQKRLATGLGALQRGDHAEARKHIFAALEFHPSSPELLLELILACSDDQDAMAEWCDRYVRASSDVRGRLKLDTATRKRLKAASVSADMLKADQARTAKRVAAVNEIARFITRQKATGKETAARALVVRWASELLLKVASGTPTALAKVADSVDKQQAAFEPDYQTVYKALARVMNQPLPSQEPSASAPKTGIRLDAPTINDRRIRAARILVGLAKQVAFKDLKGPRPPGPGKYADSARLLLEAERKRDVESGKVWQISELEVMSPEDRERFTAEHSDWHHPGLALSTNGLYRIETICGHETLLETAKTVELHHERLISHFGKDPFNGRQGIVRVVPENSDMETEGSPYWWAGGFQGGDRTTVRFAWGNIASLGKTLTHELTHRFDGVMRPFMPSWYGEGHADWTSGHYGRMTDKAFVEDYLKKYTASTTYYKGYANKNNFEKLLKGTIDDFRDNYPAGYSLYAFLNSYPPERPRYKSAMAKFVRNARAGRKDPIGYFTSVFCDGKDGRPAEFKELHAEWSKFLRACYDWQDNNRQNNKWLGKYRTDIGGDRSRLVLDVPTRSWARVHAEPFFGQEHSAASALLLSEAGDTQGVIAAGVWSLSADGWRPEVARVLASALQASRAQDAAMAFAAMAHKHFPEISPLGGGKMLSRLPKTANLLQVLSDRIDELSASKASNAAEALAREHAALTNSFGTAPSVHAKSTAKIRLPRHLGGSGFTESELTNYEERRNKGLWYVTPEGDLHVGRNKPRDATGVLDRRAHQRHAFAHSVAWQAPGHYVIRGRVHWTTSFISGAIVLGYTRRDRNIRIGFRAGDFQYAIGKSNRNDREGRVRISLQGLWERDGKLPRTRSNTTVELPEKQNWFEYELHIRGPRVEVRINGELEMNYAVHDGTPIEGHVGFATSMGAIRVQQPTVQRLDDEITSPVIGLDVAKQPRVPLEDLMQLQTRGLPIHPNGTLVLWLPTVTEGSPADGLDRAIRPLSKILQDKLKHPQQWVLALPKSMEANDRENAIRNLMDLRPERMPVVEHQIGDPFDSRYPWVLFLDSQGVLRAASNCRDVGIHTVVAGWAKLYRGRN